MANGKTKSIQKRLIGILLMARLRITKESTSMSTSKNGKTRQVGGALLFKVISRSIHKK